MDSLAFLLEQIIDNVQDAKDIVYNMQLKEELTIKPENMVHNIDNFRRQLEINGLMTSELDYFIDNYLKFCNN